MSKSLKVTIFKFGKLFLEGSFDAPEEHYDIVVGLLKEINLTREGAEDLLLGYMHAQDAAAVTEETGKMAMVATVYMLEQGESEVVINADAKPEPDKPFSS